MPTSLDGPFHALANLPYQPRQAIASAGRESYSKSLYSGSGQESASGFPPPSSSSGSGYIWSPSPAKETRTPGKDIQTYAHRQYRPSSPPLPRGAEAAPTSLLNAPSASYQSRPVYASGTLDAPQVQTHDGYRNLPTRPRNDPSASSGAQVSSASPSVLVPRSGGTLNNLPQNVSTPPGAQIPTPPSVPRSEYDSKVSRKHEDIPADHGTQSSASSSVPRSEDSRVQRKPPENSPACPGVQVVSTPPPSVTPSGSGLLNKHTRVRCPVPVRVSAASSPVRGAKPHHQVGRVSLFHPVSGPGSNRQMEGPTATTALLRPQTGQPDLQHENLFIPFKTIASYLILILLVSLGLVLVYYFVRHQVRILYIYI